MPYRQDHGLGHGDLTALARAIAVASGVTPVTFHVRPGPSGARGPNYLLMSSFASRRFSSGCRKGFVVSGAALIAIVISLALGGTAQKHAWRSPSAAGRGRTSTVESRWLYQSPWKTLWRILLFDPWHRGCAIWFPNFQIVLHSESKCLPISALLPGCNCCPGTIARPRRNPPK